jgi:two-component system CheB/CheR fusion protein
MSVDEGFEKLLEFVRDTRGFDYTPYRRPTLMRRFEKRMQAVHAADWDAYRRYLEEQPGEFGELFNSILINVTGFFRDKETWDLVASDVIPKLLDRKRPDPTIRVWSAGCASGEEPYTIAMLLAEAVGEEAFMERVRIYATDVDQEALSQAREAVYTAKSLGEVPADLRERYFQPARTGMAFRSDLRRSVIFGRNHLMKDPPISRVDLLVSRNTLMYFGPDAQERILANFYFALNRNGFLVVGKAEALQSGRGIFTPYDLKRRVFVKDGTAEPGFRLPRVSSPLDVVRDSPVAPELGDTAFEHAPLAQLVVDDDNRVAALNQAARTLFGLKPRDVGRYLQDLEVSYRPAELRSLIDHVRTRHEPVTDKVIQQRGPNAAARTLEIQVAPLLGPGDRLVGVSVSFLDVTAHRMLEEHLEHARGELETAYEELQSTVEELETTNEELQSTNEELETTNEELQSTNEELETMNEELQSTNEELETMNDELRERTEEALQANTFLGSVLSSIDQTVVVVDRELRVVAWNRLAAELWGLRDDEVEGQHLLNLDIGLPVAELRDPLRRVLAGEQADGVVVEGHDRLGHRVTYAVSLAPLKEVGSDGDAEGAILLMATSRVA